MRPARPLDSGATDSSTVQVRGGKPKVLNLKMLVGWRKGPVWVVRSGWMRQCRWGFGSTGFGLCDLAAVLIVGFPPGDVCE
jgi:hypothetical protein